LLPIILTNPDFPYSPTPQNLGENEEEKVTGKAPIGCASFTLNFICLDAGESPPPVERGERASQPHLGLQAVAGSHLHLLQIACWLVLNGNTCQMLLQIFCRIERERERERERGETHTHTQWGGWLQCVTRSQEMINKMMMLMLMMLFWWIC
jgi:hypothetical protein